MSIQEPTWGVRRRRGIDEISYGSGGHQPQYAALHLSSSYLRLVCSPNCSWGTSIVLLPSFWRGGRYYQGAPVKVDWQTCGTDFVGSFSGKIAGLRVHGQLRLLPPEPNLTTAIVTVAVEGDASFDEREGFKPVVLSSMNVSPQEWDCDRATVDDQSLEIPKAGWIVHPALRGKSFGLSGGTSAKWKTNAPTVQIILDREMQVSGWVTRGFATESAILEAGLLRRERTTLHAAVFFTLVTP